MPYALIFYMHLEIPGTKHIWHMRLDALSADGMCGRNFIGRPKKRPVTKCLAKKRPDTKR